MRMKIRWPGFICTTKQKRKAEGGGIMRIVGMILPADKIKHCCPVCKKEYASEKKLAEHIKKEHAEDKPK